MKSYTVRRKSDGMVIHTIEMKLLSAHELTVAELLKNNGYKLVPTTNGLTLTKELAKVTL